MNSPIKYHGGKSLLARKIVALMPKHQTYVEPYFGGGSVLFAHDPFKCSEVANDINKELTNFWTVLQDFDLSKDFLRICGVTPFSQIEWERAKNIPSFDKIGTAVLFFIRCRQSLAGRMKSFASLTRNRLRRGMNEQVSAWLSAVDGLPEVHARLRRVLVLNRDALDVIRQFDGPKTLFYLDPPYLQETRTAKEVYDHEMTKDQHKQLLRLVLGCKGKVMLSGYRSSLYDKALKDWTRHDFTQANHAAGGKTKRKMTESLWCNFSSRQK